MILLAATTQAVASRRATYTKFLTDPYWENDDANHHALAHYGVRTERHKLIHFYGDGLGLPGTSPQKFAPEWELHDLELDPAEVRNVYHDEAYRHVRERLKVRLAGLQAEVGDEPYAAPDEV